MSKNYPRVQSYPNKIDEKSRIRTQIIYQNFGEIDYRRINDSTGESDASGKTLVKNLNENQIKLPLNDAKEKFVLKLGTEKISLKSQSQESQKQKQLINKSITTETETITTNKASNIPQQRLRRFSFNIAPKKPSSSSSLTFSTAPTKATTTTAERLDESKEFPFPEIKLTSSVRRASYAVPLKPTLTSFQSKTKPLSSYAVSSTTSNQRINETTDINDKQQRDSLDSESNSQRGGNGSSTSPESLLDNILSAASSISVQSSSSGSVTTTTAQFGIKPPTNTSNNSTNSPAKIFTTKEMHANRLLTLKATASPELRVLPATPTNGAGVGIAVGDEQRQSIVLMPPPPPPLPSPASSTFKISVSDGLSSSGIGVGARVHQVPQTLQLPLTPDVSNYETASSVHSISPTPTPTISIRVTSDLSSQFPEELKCIICTEPFRDPRTLHCLHSFCFQCLVDENFKQDSNLWSQPVEISDDMNATNRSNYSLRSSTPEISIPGVGGGSNVAGSEVATVSPARQRGSSFSLRRKKSMEKILLKSKNEGRSSSCSSTTNLNNYTHDRLRSIECRICKYQTELPLGGLRQLPQNFMLVRKIEELRLKAGDEVLSRVWCSLCVEETNATYHCVTCTLNLCTLCKDSHERQRTTSNHRIKNIMELRRARKQKQHILDDVLRFTPKCGIHTGFEMKTFCITCFQLVCTDCVILLHKGHKHETIQRSIQAHAKLLRDSAEQTRPLCNYGEHSIERLNEIAKNINRKCDEIQAEVENFVQSYYKAVEVHGRTLLQQVHRARESKVEMILEQQMDLEKRTQEAMEAVKFCQELTDYASDAEILSFVGILVKRFDYCQKFKSPVDPKISDSLHFLPKLRAPATKEQNDIPLFGIITMQTVEPTLCTLQTDGTGATQLRLHKKVELTLYSRDADGASLCHGGLQLQCIAKYKEFNSRYLPTEVADNRDGTYNISFMPDAQGTIILTIVINDKPIKGSPFTFLARQLRPHSGIYHCCAFCSSKGNRAAKCSCEGRMPGYSGCGHGHAGHPGRRHWSCCGNVLEKSECLKENPI